MLIILVDPLGSKVEQLEKRWILTSGTSSNILRAQGYFLGSEKRATEFYPWVPEDVLCVDHIGKRRWKIFMAQLPKRPQFRNNGRYFRIIQKNIENQKFCVFKFIWYDFWIWQLPQSKLLRLVLVFYCLYQRTASYIIIAIWFVKIANYMRKGLNKSLT
jgi:hypothetical protein